MKRVMRAIKNAWNSYCEGAYEMNKSVYEAGLILI